MSKHLTGERRNSLSTARNLLQNGTQGGRPSASTGWVEAREDGERGERDQEQLYVLLDSNAVRLVVMMGIITVIVTGVILLLAAASYLQHRHDVDITLLI